MFRILRALVFPVILLGALFWDLPDRLAAERSGPQGATVTGYRRSHQWRSPWIAQIATDDGRGLESDPWHFRWIKAGDRTSFTQARGVYVGGWPMRWVFYVVVFPAALVTSVLEVITAFRLRGVRE